MGQESKELSRRSLMSSSWNQNCIPESRNGRNGTNGLKDERRSAYQHQSPPTTFGEEIRNLINRHERHRPRFPSYPSIPPPTAYRNNPLKALPAITFGYKVHQSTQSDNNQLCRFFGDIARSSSSAPLQNFSHNQSHRSISNRQCQVQMEAQRSQHHVLRDTNSQSFYHNGMQRLNECAPLDPSSRNPPINLYPLQTRQDPPAQHPHYINYPHQQVSYTSVPRQLTCHNQNLSYPAHHQGIQGVQSRMSVHDLEFRDSIQSEEGDLSFYDTNVPLNLQGGMSQCTQPINPSYCHQTGSLYQQPQRKSLYEHRNDQQSNPLNPLQNDPMYYQPPEVRYPHPMAPHLQQQVNIQQAHLTLKTTQVATTMARNFQSPCSVYPSVEALCNMWTQPRGQSPPSHPSHSQQQIDLVQQAPLQYMSPCQVANFTGGLSPSHCSLPLNHQQNMTHHQPRVSNMETQGMSQSSPNLSTKVSSHTVVDLGTRSSSNLHLNHSGLPQQSRKLTPWSLKNVSNCSDNWDTFQEDDMNLKSTSNFPTENPRAPTPETHSPSQNELKGPLQLSTSTPSAYPLERKSVQKRAPWKGKGRGGREGFNPTGEDLLRDLEKDLHNKSLEQGVVLIQGSKWMENVLGLKVVILQARENVEKVAEDLSSLLFHVNRHMQSPKSKVCRQAISCFRELFVQLGPLMDFHLDGIAEKLFRKSLDTNKFIRDECELALEAFVRNCSPHKVISYLDSAQRNHKNGKVKRMSCRMTRVFIDKWTPRSSIKEHGEKLLPMLYEFLQEPTNEVREEAKKALRMLVNLKSFDDAIERHVSPEVALKLEDRIERIKDEVNNRTPRRRRKKNENKKMF